MDPMEEDEAVKNIKKLFSLVEAVAGILRETKKAVDLQHDINIFLVKRIERLEKKQGIDLN